MYKTKHEKSNESDKNKQLNLKPRYFVYDIFIFEYTT